MTVLAVLLAPDRGVANSNLKNYMGITNKYRVAQNWDANSSTSTLVIADQCLNCLPHTVL